MTFDKLHRQNLLYPFYLEKLIYTHTYTHAHTQTLEKKNKNRHTLIVKWSHLSKLHNCAKWSFRLFMTIINWYMEYIPFDIFHRPVYLHARYSRTKEYQHKRSQWAFNNWNKPILMISQFWTASHSQSQSHSHKRPKPLPYAIKRHPRGRIPFNLIILQSS